MNESQRLINFVIIGLCLSASAPAYAQTTPRNTPKYLGPGSCSAVACHGGIQPANVTPIQQNEYSIWIVQDKHAKAYSVLENPVSQRMANILGIGKPEQSQKCLACHALSVPTALKGRDFDINEGVSCESCHGPSSAWLGPHTVKGSTTKQSIALGMFDTKDLLHRAQNCMTCHVGTAEKFVDHEMIAAGHPDLIFELDSYSAVEPPHWKPAANPYEGVHAWSVGQAVQLAETLKRLSRRVNSGNWPEYSELDCFSCHHSLTKPENSWRQERGYHQQKPGNPPLNDAHYVVFRALVKDMDPAASKELEERMAAVYAQASRLHSDRQVLIEAANAGAAIAFRLASDLDKAAFDRARTARLLRSICADADRISVQGPRSAEQATMALDSAFIAYAKESGPQPEVRAAIDALFQQLDNPSAYNAPRFATAMKRVGSSLK